MAARSTTASRGDRKSDATLEEIQMQINAVTDESLASTRRMVGYCEEAKDAGIKTVVVLDEQREQLDRIEDGMNVINHELKSAEKDLDNMEKCCGLCYLPWKRLPKFGRSNGFSSESSRKRSKDSQSDSNNQQISVEKSNKNQTQSQEYITRITNDAREDEMNQNLGEVNTLVFEMKQMAVDIGSEINGQNKQLIRIQEQTDLNRTRIDEATKRAEKMIA